MLFLAIIWSHKYFSVRVSGACSSYVDHVLFELSDHVFFVVMIRYCMGFAHLSYGGVQFRCVIGNRYTSHALQSNSFGRLSCILRMALLCLSSDFRVMRDVFYVRLEDDFGEACGAP